MGRLFIIGIGGVTCGGKTTLTNKLRDLFPRSDMLFQDDFYWPDDSEHHTFDEYPDYVNYDMLGAFDMDTMVQKVHKLKREVEELSESRFLLVEGILIFNHRDLSSLFDKKFFLTLPKEESFKRRKLREYLPPLPPDYDERVTWPMYLKHKKEITNQRDIVYLDGTMLQEDVLQFVKKELVKLTEAV
ncbi:nicotinamide riboside kinase 1-like [Lineus longissimus]|uniref:nicotinamide riboside kinase 1-like n=1 Tax=Lineus longissimus TaxID=88925 RepID=UPI00315DB131